MKMTNRWSRFIYRLCAPIYDAALGHFFMPGRKRALIFDKFLPEDKSASLAYKFFNLFSTLFDTDINRRPNCQFIMDPRTL